MRVVIFLSKFTFICNIAFLLFVLFGWIERTTAVNAVPDKVIHLPIAKELIIILGFTAIFINLIMNLIYLIVFLMKRLKQLPRLLLTINFLFLVIEFCYFFLFNK